MFIWQTWIIIGTAIVSIPLYCRVLYVLYKYRKRKQFQTHFYTITRSQGIIDILGFFVYFASFNLRELDTLKPFFWSMRNSFFVPFSYSQTYLFMYGRIIGIVLISIQRCFTVAYPNSRINHLFVSAPWWSFWLFQWLFPIPLCANILFFTTMSFDAEATMNVKMSQEALTIHYIRAVAVPVIGMAVCTASFIPVIHVIRSSGLIRRALMMEISSDVRREVQLTVQTCGLLLALLLISIHFILQTYFNFASMNDAVYLMRSFLPLWVGFLTFINPWMILFVNRDVRHLVLFRTSSGTDSLIPKSQISQYNPSRRGTRTQTGTNRTTI